MPNDEDELEYSSELVTAEQVEALNRLLALPWKPGFEIDWGEEDAE